MECNLTSSTSSEGALKDAINLPVIDNENLSNSEINCNTVKADKNDTKVGFSDKNKENGVNLNDDKYQSVICPKNDSPPMQKARPASPPQFKLVGDDGTTIIVKDVTAKSTSGGRLASPKHQTTKDKDSDSGIGFLSSEKNKSWLLRLFESKLFDTSMAISYMFNSKEPGVLGYIGNRLFTYPNSEIDFYLPQLVSMYIMSHEVAEVIHPYIVHRCRNSVDFSLRCAWLLEAYVANDGASSNKKKAQHGIKLKNLILSGELVPKDKNAERDKLQKPKKTIYTHSQSSKLASQKRPPGHVRSRSDATGLLNCEESKHSMRPFTTAAFLPDHATAAIVGNTNYCHTSSIMNTNKPNLIPPLMGGGVGGARYTPQPFYPNSKINALHQHNTNGRNHPNCLNSTPSKPKLSLGDLTSGRAFENGCTCFESCKAAVNDLCGRKTHCTCGAPRLAPQQEFVRALLSIGKRLGALQIQGGSGSVSQNKEAKTQRLLAELSMLNLNLPARVWVPIHSDITHLVVRVPPQAATVLNSKDRAPYIIYVECLEVEDVAACPVPQKIVNSSISCTSQRNNFHESIAGPRNLTEGENKHQRSKSEERLAEGNINIASSFPCRNTPPSSGCGMGSTSTGDSTSSSSPGVSSAVDSQNTKEVIDQQDPIDETGRVLSLGTSASTVSLPVMMLPNFQQPGSITGSGAGSGGIPDIDCWSQEDDELTLQYPEFRSLNSMGYGSKSSSLSRRDAAFAPDTISMMSIESTDSNWASGLSSAVTEPIFVAAKDIRRRLSENLKEPTGKSNISPGLGDGCKFFNLNDDSF